MGVNLIEEYIPARKLALHRRCLNLEDSTGHGTFYRNELDFGDLEKGQIEVHRTPPILSLLLPGALIEVPLRRVRAVLRVGRGSERDRRPREGGSTLLAC